MPAKAALTRHLAVACLLVAAALAAIAPLTADASPPHRQPSLIHGGRHGIDVSHWQGRINWYRVRRAGITFAIAKATDGLHGVDGTYHRNARMARLAKIPVTAYHFARPNGGIANARAQADFFLKHANLQPGDLVPALDLEKTGGLGPVALERWVMAFLQRVEQKLGAKPIVYSSPGFWTGRLGNTRAIAKAGFRVLWVAHWGTAKPTVPARHWMGSGWTIWQWTKCGRVAGIQGCVDRDTLSGVRLQTLTIRAQRALRGH